MVSLSSEFGTDNLKTECNTRNTGSNDNENCVHRKASSNTVLLLLFTSKSFSSPCFAWVGSGYFSVTLADGSVP